MNKIRFGACLAAAAVAAVAAAASPWAGKNVVFLGDSITDAAQTNRPQRIYWQYLADDLGFVPHVYAVSGYQWDRVYKAARLMTLSTDFKRPIPEVKYPGVQFDGMALAKSELKQHLARVANVVPYEFRFEKPVDEPAPAPFESRYRVDGRTVWLWGDDSGPEEVWDWGDDRGRETQRRNGTLFAVELFAERELGVKWLWPGEDGVLAPFSDVLKLPAKSDGRYVSTLLKARIRNYEAYHPTTWEMVSNSMPRALFDAPPPSTFESRWLWQKRMRLQDREFFTYGHAFTNWKVRFGKSHPEYLNLRAATGERGAVPLGDGPEMVKLCVSNDAVVDQIVADWCAAGTNLFLNVCENDRGNWCECAGCRALDVPKEGESPYAHLTDRYVNLWNRIAAKASAIRPDVMLTTYIYSAYRHPPRRERIEHPKNMLFGFVCTESDDCLSMVKECRTAGMERFFFRPNYFHSTTTIHRGLERYFYDQFHDLLKLGMIGCDYDADANRPATAFEFYVMARAFSDPSAKFDDIAEDYCSAYGAAADEVKAYYEAVRKTGEAARAKRQAAKIADPEMFRDGVGKLPDAHVYGRDAGELAEKKAIVDAALAKHEASGDLSPVELSRLRSLALQAEHGLLTYRFMTDVAGGTDEALRRSADELQKFRVANSATLPDVYSHIYRHSWAEFRYWRKCHERLSGGALGK